MFKCRLLGDTVIEFPQSAGVYLSSSSHLIHIFREGVIEQCLPPDRYGSIFCNVSNTWILELVNTAQLLSSWSLFHIPRFWISISRTTFLLGTQRAWMEGHGHQGPFARIIALLGTNRTRCRRWQRIIHRGDEAEEADDHLVPAFVKVSFHLYWAAVTKHPVAAADFRSFVLGVTESQRSSSAISWKSSCTSESWSSVSSTSGGFYLTSACQLGHRVYAYQWLRWGLGWRA